MARRYTMARPSDRVARTREIALNTVDPSQWGIPSRPVSDAAAACDALAFAAQHCNVLAPVMRVDFLPRGYNLGVRMFSLDGRWEEDHDQSGSNGTYYRVNPRFVDRAWQEPIVSMHGQAIALVTSVAGVSTVADKCKVDRVDRFRWRATSTLTMRTIDGTHIERTFTKDLDLGDDSPEIVTFVWDKGAGRKVAKRWSDARLGEARRHGPALAETRAFLRAARKILGIRPLHIDDARRPYVAPVLVFSPDMDDPAVKLLVTAHELQIGRELFEGTVGEALADTIRAGARRVSSREEVIDASSTIPTTAAPPRTSEVPALPPPSPIPDNVIEGLEAGDELGVRNAPDSDEYMGPPFAPPEAYDDDAAQWDRR